MYKSEVNYSSVKTPRSRSETITLRSKTPAGGRDGGGGAREESGGEAKGAKAKGSGKESSLVSGSGGLGEEGIVPAPEGRSAVPGEGRRGAISGES
ncbi:unnamed protein product [Arabis nemorensis]|uniref:Uncharacterized protein n=1 Tax=Arabis nemorensis TaxID=586526 RepID=A0A565B240_9BRAS|nr:unnamed protein product [Arabis nemorensis]